MAPGVERIKHDCAKCHRDLEEGHAVHLWDGKDYCQECVFVASPRLAAAAERFSVLSEWVTVSPWEAVWDVFIAWCSVAPVLVVVLWLGTRKAGGTVWEGLVLGIPVALSNYPGVPCV